LWSAGPRRSGGEEYNFDVLAAAIDAQGQEIPTPRPVLVPWDGTSGVIGARFLLPETDADPAVEVAEITDPLAGVSEDVLSSHLLARDELARAAT
jgi:hypothetical protein